MRKKILFLGLVILLSITFPSPCSGKITTKVDKLIFLCDGTKYYRETHRALKGAKDSILVVMYLFKKHGELPNHPVNVFIKDLVQAKERGVRVKVILDESRKFSKTGEIINQGAYEVLKKAGIDVSYDSSQVITHTKLAIIDEYITIVGSHNWSAMAIQENNESSVLIYSSKVAQEFMNWIKVKPSGIPSKGLNINTATQKELEALPGIGPVLAQRILSYRKEHGPFASIDEIGNVPGIGSKTFLRIRDRITTESVAKFAKPVALQDVSRIKEASAQEYLQMAENYYLNRMYEEALREYQKIITEFPKSKEANIAKERIKEIKAK